MKEKLLNLNGKTKTFLNNRNLKNKIPNKIIEYKNFKTKLIVLQRKIINLRGR